jgi:hypothetical protein
LGHRPGGWREQRRRLIHQGSGGWELAAVGRYLRPGCPPPSLGVDGVSRGGCLAFLCHLLRLVEPVLRVERLGKHATARFLRVDHRTTRPGRPCPQAAGRGRAAADVPIRRPGPGRAGTSAPSRPMTWTCHRRSAVRRTRQGPRADVHARLLPDLAPAPRLGLADLHRRDPPVPANPAALAPARP